MIHRLSTTFLRTLRDDPADAEVPSHRLLVRAGYIRRAAPGGYTWLPLGWAVYRKVEEIVREEMNAIGAQEVHFPAMLPRDPYEATNRWTEYGDNLFRLKDRRGVDYLLGPTHEEMFTLLVKDLYSSYKDLPVSLYQIQTKYRDEARPRAGLLRGREFSMKDSYSFDLDDAGLEKSYQAHRCAYVKIFDRLGLPYVIVSAMAGAMGGSRSEEFLAECEVGEDTFVRCSKCNYAANTEAVKSPSVVTSTAAHPNSTTIETPNSPTIDSLVTFLNSEHANNSPSGGWNAAHTLKNVVVTLVHPDGSRVPLVIGVPGNREVDLKRVEAQMSPFEIDVFAEEDFAKHPVLVRGYIGPEVLGESSPSGIRYVVDPRVAQGTAWVTGANEAGKHRINVVCGRDFTPDAVVDAVEVLPGDPCPECGSDLRIDRGIEIGHVFQLGKKYAEALDLKVLDQNGKTQVVTMGSYGIGVSRVVAAIAESTHDELGLCWPKNISPADVHLVTTGKNGDELYLAAEKFAQDLESAGLTVLFDDRNGVSPGVKFKDAELIGVPVIAVIGKKFEGGHIEVRERKGGIQHEVPIEDALNTVIHLSKVN